LTALLTRLTKRYPKAEGEAEEEAERLEAIRAVLQKIDPQKLQALVGRAFADSLKSPSQKLGTARPPGGTPPAKKTKPAGKGKSRPASKQKRSRPRRRGTSR
jgi:hypothetical protein